MQNSPLYHKTVFGHMGKKHYDVMFLYHVTHVAFKECLGILGNNIIPHVEEKTDATFMFEC